MRYRHAARQDAALDPVARRARAAAQGCRGCRPRSLTDGTAAVAWDASPEGISHSTVYHPVRAWPPERQGTTGQGQGHG